MKSVGKIITLMLLIVAVSFTSFNIYAQDNTEIDNTETYNSEQVDLESLEKTQSNEEKLTEKDMHQNTYTNDKISEEGIEKLNQNNEDNFKSLKGSVSRFLVYTSSITSNSERKLSSFISL